jgi:hypothetical protein
MGIDNIAIGGIGIARVGDGGEMVVGVGIGTGGGIGDGAAVIAIGTGTVGGIGTGTGTGTGTATESGRITETGDARGEEQIGNAAHLAQEVSNSKRSEAKAPTPATTSHDETTALARAHRAEMTAMLEEKKAQKSARRSPNPLRRRPVGSR